MAGLLTVKRMNAMRRRLLGADAALRLYKLPVGAPAQLVETVTDGWYVIRQTYTKNSEGDAQPSWLHLHKSAVTAAALHQAARCEVDANGYTLRFNFDDKVPAQQLGEGWTIPLTQVDVQEVIATSTDYFQFINGSDWGLIGGGYLAPIG